MPDACTCIHAVALCDRLSAERGDDGVQPMDGQEVIF